MIARKYHMVLPWLCVVLDGHGTTSPPRRRDQHFQPGTSLCAYPYSQAQGPEHDDRLHGQITPVIVVMEEGLWVLIDGYLRVQALTHLGRDTVPARICRDGEMKALFQLISRCGERQWQAVEQAWILRDQGEVRVYGQ
ncbi:MAG: ParB N-terminal domain-containing protein [Deltaproteobacteria bacterium]|nr:ParB N-terminal domain-containing protein [Deltaproteobacteria bacterium]